MQFAKKSFLLLTVAFMFFTHAAIVPETAEAGPLMDWLLRRRTNRTAYRQPYYPQQQPQAGCTTCTQTCQRVVASYVPYTAYRTCQERVPVITYRQTSSVDPCTGCQITCNRPCTTYRMQARRVPYTAYRTVYRTETFRTPVTPTYAASPCSTCPTSACNSCSGGTQQYANPNPQSYGTQSYGNVQPYANSNAQPFEYNAPATYQRIEPTPTPADAAPSLTDGGFKESTITNYPPSNGFDTEYRSQIEYRSEVQKPSTDGSDGSSSRRIPAYQSSPSNDTESEIERLQRVHQEWKREQSGLDLGPADGGGVVTNGSKASSAPGSRTIPQYRANETRGRSASLIISERRFNYTPRMANRVNNQNRYQTENRNAATSVKSQQHNSQWSSSRADSPSTNSNRAVNSGWTSGN